jgi:hypothetical protein
LAELAPDVRLLDDPDALLTVGGDFLTSPDILDAAALCHDRIRRWGSNDQPNHIIIPPRPHVAAWIERLQLQLEVEHPQSILSFCCIVPREKCPALLDTAALLRLIPQLKPLLDDPRLAVHALAVGERPPVIRVPADSKQLPPATWERAYLPRNRVLLILNLRRTTQPTPLTTSWIRGSLPDPAPGELELLRIEYDLPPATRERAAPKEAMKALRRVATHVGVAFTAAHRLQQIQTTHGGLVAILAVPREEALRWLRGSGCGGLISTLTFLLCEPGDGVRVEKPLLDAFYPFNATLSIALAGLNGAMQ